MSLKTLMSESNGTTPYPKISGAKQGGKTNVSKVALSPQTGANSMTACMTCGMGKDANPAHSSDYSGAGKHSYKVATKSYGDSVLITDEAQIFFGGELKALGEGRIGGMAVLFTTDKDPDVTNDFFTAETDFWLGDDTKSTRPVLYDHGLDATLKSRKLGRGTLEIKDAGVWFETQLSMRDDYDKYIYKMAETGKLGISTGSAPHLIKREAVGKSQHIKSWPIVEISLTPMPVEPRTSAMALKSYAEDENRLDLFKGVVDEVKEDDPGKAHEFEPEDGSPGECAECGLSQDQGEHLIPEKNKKGLRPMKGAFEEELAERTISFYDLGHALCDVCKDIASAADTVDISGGDVNITDKVTEAVTEYAARLIPMLSTQIQDWLDKGGGDQLSEYGSNGAFYVKGISEEPSELESFIRMSAKSTPVSGVTLDEHSSKVVSALSEYENLGTSLLKGIKSWMQRCKDKIEFRAEQSSKSGRTISAATLSKLADAREKYKLALAAHSEVDAHIGDLMELAAPKKKLSESEVLSMQITTALAKHQNEMLGIGPSSQVGGESHAG